MSLPCISMLNMTIQTRTLHETLFGDFIATLIVKMCFIFSCSCFGPRLCRDDSESGLGTFNPQLQT